MDILKSILAVCILLWLGTVAAGKPAAAGESPLEYSVKGAYLFKFSGFVEWPPAAFVSPTAPLVISVLGDDPFGAVLDQMVSGQSVGGRSVEVRRIQRIGDVRGTHILYISQSEEGRMGLIEGNLRDGNVLTVADFNRPGIVISFVMEDNKVRFVINLDQAQRAGLKLNSRLLAVASSVQGK